MAFQKKKPINPLKPFNTTGAPMKDHNAYVEPKRKPTTVKKTTTKKK